MRKSGVELIVLLGGVPQYEYRHRDETFVEAHLQQEYVLHIANNCNRRVLVVPSVDGLSVMDGKEASYQSSGYILEAHTAIDVPGWRLNNQDVAKFIFVSEDESYAQSKGKSPHHGVIGLAVFQERPSPPQWVTESSTYRARYSTTSDTWQGKLYGANSIETLNIAPPTSQTSGILRERGVVEISCAAACEPASSAGTAFGPKTAHQVIEEAFEKASSTPAVVLELRYDTKDGLARRGITVEPKRPSAFPGELGHGCTPPSGWRG